jgi:hypothetical protein
MKYVLASVALILLLVPQLAYAPVIWHAAKASLFPHGVGTLINSNAGLFVDPRDAAYGASCSSTFNVNNSSNDDAPGVQLALNTGLPVVIPFPGCKFVTQVHAVQVGSSTGSTLFSFGGAGPYDALIGLGGEQALTSPYIFVPDAATGATNKCIFDTVGLEGVTWRYITVIGNSMFNGISAFCNSVGIANGRPQAFATLDHVSITDMAGIGGATDSTCQPTGTLDVPVFQLSITSLKMGHDCFGIYGNYSDVFATDLIMGNIWNSCLASPTGGGISLSASNWRCEFTGHFDSNPIYRDGVAIYVSQPGRMQLSNITFDHVMGQCIAADGNNTGGAGWTTFNNVFCRNAVSAGWVTEGGKITNPCNYLLENQAGYIAATNMSAESFSNQVPYNLCFAGTQAFKITWTQTSGDGPNTGGGWRIAMLNGTLPDSFYLLAPGFGTIDNDVSPYTISLPTSCSGRPTGSWAVVATVFTVCP